MRKVKYVGSFHQIDVAGLAIVKRGETVDLPDNIAEELVNKGVFEFVDIAVESPEEEELEALEEPNGGET